MSHTSSLTSFAVYRPERQSFLNHPVLYNQLFYLHPLPKFIVSAETLHFLNVNKSAAQHFGYSHEEFSHLTLPDLWMPPDSNAIKQQLEQTTTESCMSECQLQKRSGELVYMELFSLPFPVQQEPAWLITLTDITTRKQAERELEEKELRYKMFIQQSSEAIWRFELREPVSIQLPEDEMIRQFDERFYLAECNDVMARMYGREKAEDIIGLTTTKILPPGEPATKAFYQECIRSRFKVRDLISHEVNLNGQRKVFSNTYVGIIESDYLLRVWGTQRDITDQWEAQQQEKLLAGMIENAPDAIYSITPDRTILTWNKACEELTGIAASEIIGNRSSDFLKYSYTDVSAAAVMETLMQQGSWKGEVLLEHRHTGAPVYLLVTITALKNEQNVLSRLIVFCKNITDRKQAEKEIAQQAERLTSIFESITDGFLAMDANFIITMWNKGAEKIFAIKPEDIIGKPAYVNFKSYKNTPGAAVLNAALLGKQSTLFEEFVTATKLWSECKVYPHPGGFFLYFKDVTGRKRKELLLRLQMQLLERSANTGTSVKELADTLTSGLEEIFPGTIGTLCILDGGSGRLQTLSAPSLPESYCRLKNGRDIGAYEGLCTTAAFLKERVIVADTATDPHWQKYKHIAEDYGLKAACAFPVLSSQHTVLAVLGTYYKEPHHADADELETLQRLASLFAVVLEKRMVEEKMQLTNKRYELVKKATNEAIWETDLATGIITWGEGFSRLFGHQLHTQVQRCEFYRSFIHPQDQKKAEAAFEITNDKKIYTAEYRLKRCNGTFAHVQDTGYLICNEEGTPLRLVGSLRDITEQKNLEQRLLEEELNKQRLIKEAILQGSERQRAEISKELHDNVNQILSSAKLYLSIARQQECLQSELVDKSIGFIDTSINEIRKLSHSLAPPGLQHLGLREAIESLIRDIHRVHPLRIQYRSDAIEETISEELQLSLYRIVQEQLNNILKYAKAQQVTIALHREDAAICMSIKDDGIGFDLQQVRKGLGLTNIANRAALFNGAARIDAAPGNGCQITVTLPFAEN